MQYIARIIFRIGRGSELQNGRGSESLERGKRKVGARVVSFIHNDKRTVQGQDIGKRINRGTILLFLETRQQPSCERGREMIDEGTISFIELASLIVFDVECLHGRDDDRHPV